MVKEGVDGDCETVEMSRVVSGSEASSQILEDLVELWRSQAWPTTP